MVSTHEAPPGLCRSCQPSSHQVGGHHLASSNMMFSGSRPSLAKQVRQPALVLHGLLGLHHQCHAVCSAMCRPPGQPCSQCAVSSLAAYPFIVCLCAVRIAVQQQSPSSLRAVAKDTRGLSHCPCTAVHSQRVTGEEEHLLELGSACPEAHAIRAGSRTAQVSHVTCAARLYCCLQRRCASQSYFHHSMTAGFKAAHSTCIYHALLQVGCHTTWWVHSISSLLWLAAGQL